MSRVVPDPDTARRIREKATAPVSGTLAAFVDEVGTEGPVAVEGGRTRWGLGGPPADGVRFVRAPTGVVEYVPEEMTVRVGAGTPVAELHAVLAVHGQRTTLPERGGTVGGALAVGHSGIHRLGRGPVRDAVLEIRYVSAEGRLVRAGGPTVKNVTGYDLCRLLVGSLGRLGLIGEVLLRTWPVPATARWFRVAARPEAVWGAVPGASSVLWDGDRVWVHLEGHPDDVAAEVEVLAGLGDLTEVEAPPPLPPHRHSVAPAGLADHVSRLGGRWVAEIGVGLVHADEPPPSRRVDPTVVLLHRRLLEAFDPTGRLNPGRHLLPLEAGV